MITQKSLKSAPSIVCTAQQSKEARRMMKKTLIASGIALAIAAVAWFA